MTQLTKGKIMRGRRIVGSDPLFRTDMKTYFYLMLITLAFSFLGTADKRPPNIVLILADDIGIEGIGSYGSESYKTPHLDQMAQEGVRFTHAYSQPLCTPTRLEIMTGKDNHRNWSYFGILNPEERTFGHLMKVPDVAWE